MFINSSFFCSEFQSVSRIVKIIYSERGLKFSKNGPHGLWIVDDPQGKNTYHYYVFPFFGIRCVTLKMYKWTHSILDLRHHFTKELAFFPSIPSIILSKYKFLFSCFFIFHNCGSLK